MKAPWPTTRNTEKEQSQAVDNVSIPAQKMMDSQGRKGESRTKREGVARERR